MLCGIYRLLWHVGPGPRVLSQNRRAAAQLGLRDEQYILIMATHFPKLLTGSGHVQGNTLWERGGGAQKEWVAEIHGLPDLYVSSERFQTSGREKLLPDEREAQSAEGDAEEGCQSNHLWAFPCRVCHSEGKSFSLT